MALQGRDLFPPESLKKNKYRFKLPDEIERYVLDPHQPSLFEVETKSNEAVKYFVENIDKAVTEAIKYLLIEAVYKFSSVKTDKGFYIYNKTEQKAFDDLLKFRFDEEKKRIRIKRKISGKLYWTPSKKKELLDRYEELLPLTQSARKAYRQLRGFGSENRKQSIKSQYPHLPAEILEQITLTSKKISPKNIVLEYLSAQYDKARVNYLHVILNQTRKERQIRPLKSL